MLDIQSMDLPSMWPLSEDARSEHLIAGKTINEHNEVHSADGIDVSENCWLSADDKRSLLSEDGPSCIMDEDGHVIAKNRKADTDGSILEATNSFLIRYPWDLLSISEQLVGNLSENRMKGADFHQQSNINGYIHLGEGSVVLPGVYIEGNVHIGKNCRIGPNCFIRGNTSIGDNVVVGQSVEVKNCIIGSNTFISHLVCVGDSIIGDNVNFGAGTMVSNFRHDGANHFSMNENDELVDTGRIKFGTILGNGVRTGINSSIYPARKIGPDCFTFPGQVVKKDLH